MKKTKQLRGANPRPMALNASALPLPHSDLLVHIHYIIEDRRRNISGRSGVVVGRWRSKPQVAGSRLDSALSFSHVDVGDAFQFINHISAVCLQPALCFFHT